MDFANEETSQKIKQFIEKDKDIKHLYQLIPEECNTIVERDLNKDTNIIEYLRKSKYFKTIHTFCYQFNIPIPEYEEPIDDSYYGERGPSDCFQKFLNRGGKLEPKPDYAILSSSDEYSSSEEEEEKEEKEEEEEEEDDEDIKKLCRERYNILNKKIESCMDRIKEDKEYVKCLSQRKIIYYFRYFIKKYIYSEMKKLKSQYLGLDPSYFNENVNENDSINLFIKLKEFLDNPDTFKCIICHETKTYQTTIDFCCVRNSCRECIKQCLTKKDICIICRKKMNRQKIYFAGSMNIERPIITYDCAEKLQRICGCCHLCEICQCEDCRCKVYDKNLIDFYNQRSTHKARQKKDIYDITGPYRIENGLPLKQCGHSADEGCITPHFGHSIIINYNTCISQSDVFILTFDPDKIDCYASFAEWGYAMAKNKRLYIIPKTGNIITQELWWYAVSSSKSLVNIDSIEKDYHILIINEINPEIRNYNTYLNMINESSKSKIF